MERYDIMCFKMFYLSNKQLERASEILGNISVAWFSAGAISPLFIGSRNIADLLFSLGVSMTLSAIFFAVSLELIKE